MFTLCSRRIGSLPRTVSITRGLSSWRRTLHAAATLTPRGHQWPTSNCDEAVQAQCFDPFKRSYCTTTQRLSPGGFPQASNRKSVGLGSDARSFSVALDAVSPTLYGTRPDSWWTGCLPEDAPGRQPNGHISSLPLLNLEDGTRKEVQDYFDNSWILTESLFAGLQGEEAFMCSPRHGLRHPLIFYYGHSAALYVNKLRAADLVKESVNGHFEVLFETGLDEMAWDAGKDNIVWPSVQEVHDYRCDVYSLVSEIIASAPEDAISNITMDNPYWALPMAFEHERIHVETSSVLIRELPIEFVSHPPTWPDIYPVDRAHLATSISSLPGGDDPLLYVESGTVVLGKRRDFPSFGWDSEYGSRSYSVPSFEGMKHMVTNSEYLEFVKDSGYARREFWTESGWRWKMHKNVKRPQFWVSEGPSGFHEYRLRTVFSEVPFPKDWPVLANFHEAKAFAKWKTMKENKATGGRGKAYRLSTELEHHMMRNTNTSSAQGPQVIDPVLATGGQTSCPPTSNLSLSYGSESPVNALPPNSKGFYDVAGSAWEWCEDNFSALQDFTIDPLYEDYSTPCFDGEHNMVMGSSFASSGNAASVFSRFYFRPHFHQHASFRLVAPVEREQAEDFVTSCTDAPPPYVGTYPFRTSCKESSESSESPSGGSSRLEMSEIVLEANLATHFAVPEVAEIDPNVSRGLHYPQRCAQLLVRAFGSAPSVMASAAVLEIGCGPGGASFELSKNIGTIVAVDGDKKLLDAACEMAREGQVAVRCPSVAGSSVEQEVRLPSDANPSRVSFLECDPMCLPASLAEFDAVLIHTILDKIHAPSALLARMGGATGMVRQSGGLLVVVSAYDWNEDVTPRESWVGGYMDKDGIQVSASQGLANSLGREFKLVHTETIPRMRPVADRVYEYSSAEATVWRRD